MTLHTPGGIRKSMEDGWKHETPWAVEFDLNENDGSIWFYVHLKQYLDSIIYTYTIYYTDDLFCSFQQSLT